MSCDRTFTVHRYCLNRQQQLSSVFGALVKETNVHTVHSMWCQHTTVLQRLGCEPMIPRSPYTLSCPSGLTLSILVPPCEDLTASSSSSSSSPAKPPVYRDRDAVSDFAADLLSLFIQKCPEHLKAKPPEDLGSRHCGGMLPTRAAGRPTALSRFFPLLLFVWSCFPDALLHS